MAAVAPTTAPVVDLCEPFTLSILARVLLAEKSPPGAHNPCGFAADVFTAACGVFHGDWILPSYLGPGCSNGKPDRVPSNPRHFLIASTFRAARDALEDSRLPVSALAHCPPRAYHAVVRGRVAPGPGLPARLRAGTTIVWRARPDRSRRRAAREHQPRRVRRSWPDRLTDDAAPGNRRQR